MHGEEHIPLAKTESFTGDGRMTYTVGQTNKHRFIGLGYTDSNQNFTDVDFGYELNANDSRAYLYENGVNRTVVSVVTGTVLEIQRIGSTVFGACGRCSRLRRGIRPS